MQLTKHEQHFQIWLFLEGCQWLLAVFSTLHAKHPSNKPTGCQKAYDVAFSSTERLCDSW